MRASESAVGVVARAHARSRRRSLLTLGVLAGLTMGLAVAALGGASRTSSALERLREHQDAADAVVFPSQVGAFEPDWEALAARPEVDRIAIWRLLFGTIDEGGPDVFPVGPTLLFGSADGTYLGEVGRPIVTEGRMYDPDAPDEMVVDENFEEVEVGDVIPFTAYGADQFTDTGEATGPHEDIRVVGRVKTLAQFLFVPDGQALVSPGFVAAHGEELQVLENADVTTVNGASDIDALEESINEVLAPGAPVLDLHSTVRRVSTTTDVERTALIALAVVILLAGIALVGQAITQSAAAATDDLAALQAMGMTRSELVGTATRAHLTAAVAAAVATVATAVVASIWFPIGIGGRIDPERGVQVTWWLLVPGVLVVVGALLVSVAWTSRRRRSADRRARPSRALSWVRRTAPVPIGLGTTMAFASDRGRTRVPTRQALVGAVFGVLGVVATLTLSAGLSDALDHPERAGVAWDAAGYPAPEDLDERSVSSDVIGPIAAADDVAAVAIAERQVIPVDGVGTPAFSVRPPPGETSTPIELVITEGRAPTGAGEVAIGPESADRLGVGIGDTVEVGQDAVPVEIVGEALFPPDVHATFDEGVWLDTASYDLAVEPFTDPELQYPERGVVVRFEDGVDADDGIESLGALTSTLTDFGPAEVPVELSNLDNVKTLPRLLAAFLVLLAIGALGHVLATSARRRRVEFAVLRSMGLSRSGTRVVLNAQGTVIGLVGLVVGIPIGIALGRYGWGLVAKTVPLDVVRPVARRRRARAHPRCPGGGQQPGAVAGTPGGPTPSGRGRCGPSSYDPASADRTSANGGRQVDLALLGPVDPGEHEPALADLLARSPRAGPRRRPPPAAGSRRPRRPGRRARTRRRSCSRRPPAGRRSSSKARSMKPSTRRPSTLGHHGQLPPVPRRGEGPLDDGSGEGRPGQGGHLVGPLGQALARRHGARPASSRSSAPGRVTDWSTAWTATPRAVPPLPRPGTGWSSSGSTSSLVAQAAGRGDAGGPQPGEQGLALGPPGLRRAVGLGVLRRAERLDGERELRRPRAGCAGRRSPGRCRGAAGRGWAAWPACGGG